MSNNTENSTDSSGAWYAQAGNNDDVILSTRIRLARNLANFSFPCTINEEDKGRVQSLVFDSFSQFEDSNQYQAVAMRNIAPIGEKILCERGIVEHASGTGIVTRMDGYVSCLVNSYDHVRISSFKSGLDCNDTYLLSKNIDDNLQKKLQFAASYDFGYLTSSIYDAGSGMKVSLRVHLPSLSFDGRIEGLLTEIHQKKLLITACYGSGGTSGLACGSYFQISNSSARNGNEFDQLTDIAAMGRYLYELENRTREDVRDRKVTSVKNIILRAYAAAKYSRLLEYREAVEIISGIKWGLDIGYLYGCQDSEMLALLYRIQDGHLEFLLKNGTFSFEKDIEESNILRVSRLRALIIQETIEKINYKA